MSILEVILTLLGCTMYGTLEFGMWIDGFRGDNNIGSVSGEFQSDSFTCTPNNDVSLSGQ